MANGVTYNIELLETLLEELPPSTTVVLADDSVSSRHDHQVSINNPTIRLYCANTSCQREMLHSPTDRSFDCFFHRSNNVFVTYMCNHCRTHTHHVALHVQWAKKHEVVLVTKIGQDPAFGPPLQNNLLSLVGPDRDAFLRGRRCENQGLGVGAFAYYRRVVENQRSKILEEVIRTAHKVGLPSDTVKQLEQAKSENQFKKSIETAKTAFPPSLLLEGGHNPLTLLHTALSEGLHAETDEACLTYATAIRVVLADLADRIDQVLADKRELTDAVSMLLKKNSGN